MLCCFTLFWLSALSGAVSSAVHSQDFVTAGSRSGQLTLKAAALDVLPFDLMADASTHLVPTSAYRSFVAMRVSVWCVCVSVCVCALGLVVLHLLVVLLSCCVSRQAAEGQCEQLRRRRRRWCVVQGRVRERLRPDAVRVAVLNERCQNCEKCQNGSAACSLSPHHHKLVRSRCCGTMRGVLRSSSVTGANTLVCARVGDGARPRRTCGTGAPAAGSHSGLLVVM